MMQLVSKEFQVTEIDVYLKGVRTIYGRNKIVLPPF
jgi:hypothetical protein